MAQAQTGEERFYIGATEDVEELRRQVAASAEIEEVSDPDEQGSHVVLVRGAERFRDTLLRKLGPNAQEVVDRSEAAETFRQAATQPQGAPYEPRGQGDAATG